MTNKEIIDIIESSKFSHDANELEGLLKPSIRLRAVPCPTEKLARGTSRLGGVPDLPPETSWPYLKDTPLVFIAQINLSEVTSLDQEHLLPAQGWLSFFYEANEQPWGFDPADRGSWKVLYFDGERSRLIRTNPPAIPEHCDYKMCSVQAESQLMLPEDNIVTSELGWQLGEAEWEAYDGLLEKINGPFGRAQHRLLGYPHPIQGDMRLECQLVAHGLYCGNQTGYNDPRAKALEDGAKEWLLLLQIDSDEEGPGWMWGDCGTVYFWIHRDDLKARSFDDVWLILQCF